MRQKQQIINGICIFIELCALFFLLAEVKMAMNSVPELKSPWKQSTKAKAKILSEPCGVYYHEEDGVQ